jgi:tetratricopeptide (TPR) repeat protein
MRFRAAILLLLCAPLCGCRYRGAVMAEDHLTAGNQAVARKAWDSARREFAAAAAARPSSAALDARIGLIYEQAGRRDEAAPWLKRALELQPRQPWSVPVALMTCLDASGRSAEAEDVLLTALRVHRRDALALNNIGYICADRGVHLQAATRLLRRAVELAPEMGTFVDSLGWCYYRQGKFDDALRLLTRAAELGPPDAEILYHRGMARLALGDSRGAAQDFTRALSANPTLTPAYQALKALTPPESREPPPSASTPAAPLMEQ